MRRKLRYAVAGSLALAALAFLMLGAGRAQSQSGPEEYQAVAMGHGNEMGQLFNVTIHIKAYSTDQERQLLVAAYQKGGSSALAKELAKQPAHGNVETTAGNGVDISYARKMPGPNGGTRIRILANHPITMAGAVAGNVSNDALAAIELDLVATKGKSTGKLLPAVMFVVDPKTHELEVQDYQDPWALTDVKQREGQR